MDEPVHIGRMILDVIALVGILLAMGIALGLIFGWLQIANAKDRRRHDRQDRQ